MHPVTAAVTERIEARSRDTRADYLARMEAARHAGPGRGKLSCANWAHAFAAESDVRNRYRNSGAGNQIHPRNLRSRGIREKIFVARDLLRRNLDPKIGRGDRRPFGCQRDRFLRVFHLRDQSFAQRGERNRRGLDDSLVVSETDDV